METPSDIPHKNGFPANIGQRSEQEQQETCDHLLQHLITSHNYGHFSFDTAPPKPLAVRIVLQEAGRTPQGYLLLKPVQIPVTIEPDEVFNYSTQLCHWYLHYLSMDDTAKEGDIDRLIANCKYNVPFFYSHSKLSKYMVENLDLILKTQYTLSPQEAVHVLELAFMNSRGGSGNNYESDLKMEHTVRSRKELIRGLGANKTERAMLRATGASDAIDELKLSFDMEVMASTIASSFHSKASTSEDCIKIRAQIQRLRPFRKVAGRKIPGVENINTDSPFESINRIDMHKFIGNKLQYLCEGSGVEIEDEMEEVFVDFDDSDDEGLPPI